MDTHNSELSTNSNYVINKSVIVKIHFSALTYSNYSQITDKKTILHLDHTIMKQQAISQLQVQFHFSCQHNQSPE